MAVARIIAPTEENPLYYDFTRWDGPAPALVRQHLESFSLAGIDGSGTRLVGVYGDPFTVRTQSAFSHWISDDSDDFTAERGAYRMRELIGQKCAIIYEGIDYFELYEHQYLVEEVVIDSLRRNVRLIGAGYDFPLGVLLTATWTLRPIYVGEGDPVPPPGSEGAQGDPISPFGWST